MKLKLDSVEVEILQHSIKKCVMLKLKNSFDERSYVVVINKKEISKLMDFIQKYLIELSNAS